MHQVAPAIVKFVRCKNDDERKFQNFEIPSQVTSACILIDIYCASGRFPGMCAQRVAFRGERYDGHGTVCDMFVNDSRVK